MSARLWRLLGLKDIRLELNTLGSSESRANYRKVLVDYLRQHHDQLDDDSQKRLETNPLRVLDSKNPAMQALINNAPSLHDYLDEESAEQFSLLKSYLDAAGIAYDVNPRLVRGLDYYCKTVFEWVTDKLGAQGTVCAGGRYDGLVEQLGGKASPAVGFALGIERLLALMEESAESSGKCALDVYLVTQGDSSVIKGLQLAESLRNQVPGLKMQTHCGGGSFKSQIKKADKSGAELALILGEDEINNNKVTVKYLRKNKDQVTVGQDAVADFLKTL
jgi:histidyl-tRNA synthetase